MTIKTKQIMERIIKLLFLSLTLIIGFSTTMLAQNKKQHITREQLAETQAQYIAGKIGMNDADSKRFIEAYEAYQKEIWNVGPRMNKKKQSSNTTEAEAEEAIKDRFERSQKILSIREKYYGIYSKFLNQKQIQQVYVLEKQMMKRLAQRQRFNRKR